MSLRIIIVAAVLLSMFLFLLSLIIANHQFYAQASCGESAVGNNGGFTPEASPCPRDLNKNPIYLSYDITTITSSNGQQHTIANLSLHENSTGQIVKYAAFYIAINDTQHTNTKAISQYSSWIMNDLFQAPNGTLVLDLVHSNSGNNNNGNGSNNHINTNHIQINAKGRDPILNAWLPSDNDDTITITNMPLQANETYVMHIEVFATDKPTGIFTIKQSPKVDLVFSGGNASRAMSNNSTGRILLVPEFGSSLTSLTIMTGALGVVVVMAARTGRLDLERPDACSATRDVLKAKAGRVNQ